MRIILPVLLLALGGCGLLGTSSLEPTAKQYYDLLVGRGGNHKYSSFFSPAYKAQVSAEDLLTLDNSLGSGQPNPRYEPISVENIAVSVDGIYGLSKANPKLGSMYGATSVKWIRVGKAWYLYLNSDAEIEAYGHFPTNLPPPQLIAVPAEGDAK